MLINLTPNEIEIARRMSIAEEHKFEYIPQCDESLKQHGDGIYECNFGFNFSHEEFLEFDNIGMIPFEQSFEVFKPDYIKDQYGVADSIEQIKEYFKEEIQNPNRKFIISFATAFQDKQNKGKGGGWRWHKWGPYIGKLDSQCEYLDDEDFGDDFECVICYHLYEIL